MSRPWATLGVVNLLGVLTLLGVMMSGCGDPRVSAEEAADDVRTSRAAVEEAARSVADVAGGVGLDLGPLAGSWSVCSAEPPRLEYGAGGSATPAGSVPDVIAALTEVLEEDGWTVEDAGSEPEPYAVLTREDLRASLGESRRHPGRVSAGVTGPCIDTTEEQDSLLGERYRVP